MASVLDDSMACGACQLNLTVGEEYLQCMVEKCGKLYHLGCNNKILSEAEKAIWVCPECICAAKKGGRNCDTPVGTPVSNVAHRKPSSMGPSTPPQPAPRRSPPQSSESNVSVSMPSTLEVMLLRDQITYLTEQLADAVSAMGRYQSALTASMDRVETISVKLEALERSLESRCAPASAPASAPTFSAVLRGQGDESAGAGSTARVEGARGSGSSRGGRRGADEEPVTLDGQLSTDDDGDSTGGGWREVPARKKQKRLTSIRCTGGPNVTKLKAVEVRKHIHLWNMVSGAGEVQEYLQELCEQGTCTVEELKSRGEYKSFKLGVPVAYYEKCLSADVWPDNARVRMWFFRKQTVQTKNSS